MVKKQWRREDGPPGANFTNATVAKDLAKRKTVMTIVQIPKKSNTKIPQINITNRSLGSITAQAKAVLIGSNNALITRKAADVSREYEEKILFRKGNKIVMLIEDDELVSLDKATYAEVSELLSRYIAWIKINAKDKTTNTDPKAGVAQNLLAMNPVGFPRVNSVIVSPVFGATGNMILRNGLHVDDKIWMQLSPSLKIQGIPDNPTQDDVAQARVMIEDELLCDFPFHAQSDRAHAIGAFLLPFMRRMIDGCTPMHMVESPVNSSGKSKLCYMISIVCTGSSGGEAASDNEEETRKKITSALVSGQQIVIFDNVNDAKVLNSSSMALLLTCETWKDRLLGGNAKVSIPNHTMWIMSGINPRLTPELTRRSIRIRITPRCERPENRKNFRHRNIISWTKQNRGALIHAFMTLIQSWIAAGKPAHDDELASFELWSACIGGVLAHVGIDGFLRDREEMRLETSVDTGIWDDLVEAWWTEHGAHEVSVMRLNEICAKRGLLDYVRGDGNDMSQITRLGYKLDRSKFSIVNGRMIVLSRKAQGRSYYRLEQMQKQQDLQLETK